TIESLTSKESAHNQFTSRYNNIVQQKINFKTKKQLNMEKKDGLTKRLELYDEKLKLLKKSSAPKITIIESTSQVEEVKSSISSLNMDVLNDESEFEKLKNSFEFDLIKRIDDIDVEIKEIESSLIKNEGSVSSISGKEQANIITAPFDGYLLESKDFFTVGSYINKMQKIVTIKRAATKTVVSGKVDAKYRAYIYKGAPVTISVRSAAVKQDLKGVISNISVDSFPRDEKELLSGRVYTVEVSIESDDLNLLNELVGVDVDFFIISRQLSIVSFISEMIFKNVYLTE
ncbi:hypothetical protein, partial [Vibrio metoecus]|uniref:hypothetical protein n=1 Tax=Vibrio metoecus TaxID=1481663 RepID=UPI00215D2F3F